MTHFILDVVALGGALYAGRQQGAAVEAKAIAVALKAKTEAGALVADLKTYTEAAFAKLKTYL